MSEKVRQNALESLRLSDGALTDRELSEREEKERSNLAWYEIDILMMLYWRHGHEAVKRHLSWIRRIIRGQHERAA